MRMLAGTVAALALAPGIAQGQVLDEDAGSSRVTLRDRGIVLSTSTAQDAQMRCASVRDGASVCARRSGRGGPLVIGHLVTRRGGVPRLGPLVVGGLAGDEAVRVRVRWSGGARTIRPRRFGAFLAALPATARQRSVVITTRYRGGGQDTTDYRRTSARMAPVAGSERVDQLLVDPTDGTRLGLLTWRATGDQLCSYLGQVVGTRVGALRGSWFNDYPVNDGGQCSRPEAGPEPLSYGITQQGALGYVAGFARSDVAAVEIRAGDEPPKTLTLSGRRAFAHAFRAPVTVTLTAIMRDGTRVERVVSTPQPMRP